jgi:hypothetical protein
MMAGIMIVYIRVIVSWEITCVIFNLGGTRASVAFFDAICACGEGWHTCV